MTTSRLNLVKLCPEKPVKGENHGISITTLDRASQNIHVEKWKLRRMPRTRGGLGGVLQKSGIRRKKQMMKPANNFFRSFLVLTFALSLLPTLGFGQHYVQTNLVSDIPGMAPVTDPHLKNPWGLDRSSGGPWWAGNNNDGTATVYGGAGHIVPLVVTVPPPPMGSPPSAPTGVV